MKRHITSVILIVALAAFAVLGYFVSPIFIDMLALIFLAGATYDMYHCLKQAGYRMFVVPPIFVLLTAYPVFYLMQQYMGGRFSSAGLQGLLLVFLAAAAITLTIFTFSPRKDKDKIDLDNNNLNGNKLSNKLVDNNLNNNLGHSNTANNLGSNKLDNSNNHIGSNKLGDNNNLGENSGSNNLDLSVGLGEKNTQMSTKNQNLVDISKKDGSNAQNFDESLSSKSAQNPVCSDAFFASETADFSSEKNAQKNAEISQKNDVFYGFEKNQNDASNSISATQNFDAQNLNSAAQNYGAANSNAVNQNADIFSSSANQLENGANLNLANQNGDISNVGEAKLNSDVAISTAENSSDDYAQSKAAKGKKLAPAGLNDLFANMFLIVYPMAFFAAAWAISYKYSGLFGLLFAIAVPIVGSDLFAYLFGKTIGGKKLCPSISPKKTIAGAVGGVFGAAAVAILFWVVFEYVGALYPSFAAKCGYIPFYGDGALYKSALTYIAIGVAVGIASELGDLAASRIKRALGIKDYGKIFPGHGGFMDRIDSVLYALVILLISFSAIYGF